MDLKPNNELQKNYDFLPKPFPTPPSAPPGGGTVTERGMHRCELISKAKVAISLCCCQATSLPRPHLLSPHHQIIAKYLLMFFFHPSKRWSPACSRAPSWFCCVWRQCSANEPSEVKGGHKGRQEPGPESPRGPPLAAHPANQPPTGGRGGDPRPVPLSRCPSPRAAPARLPGRASSGKRM